MSSQNMGGLQIVLFLVQMVIGLGVYLFVSYCLMVIANKLGVENSWLAFIPIANLYIMVQCAQKPIWWIVMFLIPCVNIIFLIMTWMTIAERRDKPNWWGILIIVPLGQLFVPAYLAFSD